MKKANPLSWQSSDSLDQHIREYLKNGSACPSDLTSYSLTIHTPHALCSSHTLKIAWHLCSSALHSHIPCCHCSCLKNTFPGSFQCHQLYPQHFGNTSSTERTILWLFLYIFLRSPVGSPSGRATSYTSLLLRCLCLNQVGSLFVK